MPCCDKESLLDAVKRLTLQRLSDRLNTAQLTHSNHDAYYSPAEWWYDENWLERHHLTTSAVWSMSGTTITLTLNYAIWAS